MEPFYSRLDIIRWSFLLLKIWLAVSSISSENRKSLILIHVLAKLLKINYIYITWYIYSSLYPAEIFSSVSWRVSKIPLGWTERSFHLFLLVSVCDWKIIKIYDPNYDLDVDGGGTKKNRGRNRDHQLLQNGGKHTIALWHVTILMGIFNNKITFSSWKIQKITEKRMYIKTKCTTNERGHTACGEMGWLLIP